MARPRRRRAPRKLTRAQRYARSPRPPAGAILAYQLALRAAAAAWVRKVRAALKGRLESFAPEQRHDAIEDEASEALDSVSFTEATARAYSAGVPDKALRHSKAEFKRIGITLPKEPNRGIERITSEWRAASAVRVEKILAKERETILELLADSEHRTPEELSDRLEERYVVAASKLETAAHDDVLTLNGQLTQERQTAAGVTQFVWTTAADERVRDSHAEMDGVECDWDDPPVVDDEQAIPGEPPNCRCVAFPKLDELDGADDPNAGDDGA